jgi:anti-repressor protein
VREVEQMIKVDFDNQVVKGRDLYEALEIKERFSVWASRQKAVFGDEITSVGSPTEVQNNGGIQIRELEDFVVSVDNAKHICLMCKTDKGKACRDYLIKICDAWNTPEQVMARALKLADRTISDLKLQIEEQKPLVDFANHVTQSADTVDALTLAKLANSENINIGRTKLFEWLRKHKVLMKNNLPYQKYIDAGLMRVVETTKEIAYGSKVFQKTVFTGKGQAWVIEKLRNYYQE